MENSSGRTYMTEINKLDDRTYLAIMHINPFSSSENLKRFRWINDWDLAVEYTDGKRYLWDGFSGGSRLIKYDGPLTRDEWEMEFRIRLNQQINRHYISQEVLAEKIQTTQPMVSRYTTGDVMPTAYVINQIANAIGCKYEDLIYKDFEEYFKEVK